MEHGDFVTVDGYEGVAFWFVGYVDDQWATVTMVGDDHKHTVEISSVHATDEDSFCHVCGQTGCTHDGRDRDTHDHVWVAGMMYVNPEDLALVVGNDRHVECEICGHVATAKDVA